MDKESMQLMSLRLCRVIEDIGISRYGIMTRRKLWLMKEDMFSTPQAAIYHFGSQSEGTATKGMQDDVDLWICKNNIYVILTWTEWQLGRLNYLLFKHEFFPPQHCWLQQLRYDSPEPVIEESTSQSHLHVPIGDKGMVVLSNSNKDKHLQEFYRCELFPNGPTEYTAEDVDAVLAYKCSEQPTECQFLFKRPRPGHWPTPVLLQQARTCGVFLVPEGHPESPETMLEWRFSTSLVERLLMFDLSVCQTKVYVLLKLIRKTYLQPMFGNRLTTFHLKTALLFTVESYPPDIWEEHRLVQCTIYCLQTLRRWLSMKYCPHFIIGGVDLFAGKLRKHEMQTVLDLMRLFVNDNLQCVLSMTTDRLGERMLRLSQLKSKIQPASSLVSNKAGMQIMFSCFQYVLVCCHFNAKLASPGVRSENDKCHALLQETMEFYLKMTDKRNEQFGEALKVFQTTDKVSVESGWFASMTKATDLAPLSRSSLPIHDMTSTRLKRAADLYCKGRYDLAAEMLTEVQDSIQRDALQVCSCQSYIPSSVNNKHIDDFFRLPLQNFLAEKVAFSIVFTKEELHRVPGCLVEELTMEDLTNKGYVQQNNGQILIGNKPRRVIIHSIPFLFYLQFLTFNQMNSTHRKSAALQHLARYVSETKDLCHIETAANCLGHCHELENRLDLAWHFYSESIRNWPRYNAANLHVMRLLQNDKAMEVCFGRGKTAEEL